jgi:hypothetical protein
MTLTNRSTWIAAVALALTGLGSTTTVRAEGASSADAERLIAEGVQLRRQHQDAAALDAFKRAYEIDKSGRTMAQIALAEQALGQWVEAERDLGNAVRMETDPWIVRNRQALSEAITDVSHHIGELDLECSVPGAELFVDDRLVGALPIQGLKLAAGKAMLEVRASGYTPTRLEVQVPAGAALRQKVELSRVVQPDPAPAATPPAVAATPSAPEGSVQRTTALIMLGSGGFLVVAGAVAHVLREQALSKYNDDQRCFYGSETRDQRCGSYKRDADTAQTVMAVGYSVGGLALGVSAVLLLTSRSRPSKSVVTLAPAPGGAHFSYATSF